MYLKKLFTHCIAMMTAKLETDVLFSLPKGFFQQQNKYLRVKSTVKSLWTGFLVQVLVVFPHIAFEYEVAGCVSAFVAGCVVVVVSYYLRFDPAAGEPFVRLFDTDVCWHLAAI